MRSILRFNISLSLGHFPTFVFSNESGTIVSENALMAERSLYPPFERCLAYGRCTVVPPFPKWDNLTCAQSFQHIADPNAFKHVRRGFRSWNSLEVRSTMFWISYGRSSLFRLVWPLTSITSDSVPRLGDWLALIANPRACLRFGRYRPHLRSLYH